MTKVLWLVKGLGPGGAERLLVSLAEELADEFDIHVVYLLPWKNHLVAELEGAGASVQCLSSGRLWDLRWLARLVRTIRSRDIDVVHAHSPLPAAMARPVVRLLGRRRPKLVYTEHNRWSSYGRATRTLNRATFRLDDIQFAVSEDARSSIPSRLRQRVEVVVHGVRLESIRRFASSRQAVRDEIGAAPDDVVVVTVANYRADKDYPTLLRAARSVLDAGRHLRFVAVGQGPLAEEVQELHRCLGLGEGFALLGHRTDAPAVIAAGDMFCLSSTHEGYPVALMEALALGKPIVATAVGGVPDAVRSGEEGMLVPPGRPDLLANAIQDVACDAALRAALAAAAAARGDDFGIGPAAARHADAYRLRRQGRGFDADCPTLEGDLGPRRRDWIARWRTST